MRVLGKTRAQLAASWDVKTSQLVHEARLRLIFQGDTSVDRAAKEASDRFRHGLAPFKDVRTYTRIAIEETDQYVRRAILQWTKVEPMVRAVLLRPPYEERFEGGTVSIGYTET